MFPNTITWGCQDIRIETGGSGLRLHSMDFFDGFHSGWIPSVEIFWSKNGCVPFDFQYNGEEN